MMDNLKPYHPAIYYSFYTGKTHWQAVRNISPYKVESQPIEQFIL
jgi:hypothetical protein